MSTPISRKSSFPEFDELDELPSKTRYASIHIHASTGGYTTKTRTRVKDDITSREDRKRTEEKAQKYMNEVRHKYNEDKHIKKIDRHVRVYTNPKMDVLKDYDELDCQYGSPRNSPENTSSSSSDSDKDLGIKPKVNKKRNVIDDDELADQFKSVRIDHANNVQHFQHTHLHEPMTAKDVIRNAALGGMVSKMAWQNPDLVLGAVGIYATYEGGKAVYNVSSSALKRLRGYMRENGYLV